MIKSKLGFLVPSRVNLQPFLTIKSKLGFLVPSRVNLESNLVKVDKNHQVARVWCRKMKNIILGWF